MASEMRRTGSFTVINDPKANHCQRSSTRFHAATPQQEARLQLGTLGGFGWILLFNQTLPLGCPVNNFISSVIQLGGQTATRTLKKELGYMSAPSLLFHEAIKAEQQRLSFLHPRL